MVCDVCFNFWRCHRLSSISVTLIRHLNDEKRGARDAVSYLPLKEFFRTRPTWKSMQMFWMLAYGFDRLVIATGKHDLVLYHNVKVILNHFLNWHSYLKQLYLMHEIKWCENSRIEQEFSKSISAYFENGEIVIANGPRRKTLGILSTKGVSKKVLPRLNSFWLMVVVLFGAEGTRGR